MRSNNKTRSELKKLFTEAALQNPEVLSNISSSAQSDPEHRKIFVYGLSYSAITEDLEAAFSQFGPIQEQISDFNFIRSKLYVTKSQGGAKAMDSSSSKTDPTLKEPQKRIGERAVSCQLVSRGPQQKPRQQSTTVNIGTDIQQAAANLGFLGAFNHLATLGLLNRTGAPGPSYPLAGLGLLNQTGAPGPSNPLAGLGLLNRTGAQPRASAGPSNFQFQ